MVSVGIVASPDYLFDETQEFPAVLDREIERCAPLRPFLAGAERVGSVRGIRRLAYLNLETVGNGWVMIGDAAGFLDPVYSSGLYLALASAELAADCIHDALHVNDVSKDRLGAFCGPLWDGVDVVWRLIKAFYDPAFSFRAFTERFPQHRAALIHCLVGDVVGKDMQPLLDALATMTPPPRDLSEHARSDETQPPGVLLEKDNEGRLAKSGLRAALPSRQFFGKLGDGDCL